MSESGKIRKSNSVANSRPQIERIVYRDNSRTNTINVRANRTFEETEKQIARIHNLEDELRHYPDRSSDITRKTIDALRATGRTPSYIGMATNRPTLFSRNKIK